MSTRLDALIERVSDPVLADQLRSAVTELQPRREFGLVFEHHLPETVELPGLQVRVGTKVRVLPPRGSLATADTAVYRVSASTGTTAHLVTLDGTAQSRASVVDLVRVADFADPIYPGLRTTERHQLDDADRPWHTLINAENYHALQALQFTHAGRVDTIYIDPPYNTSNDDWIYSDRHVSGDDGYRHSKWLSFMERRLVLARALLKPTGVIIVAIGDDEHHRLRMLLDQVFGEPNFISDVVWQGGRKNDSRYVSNGADYMLIYARDESSMRAHDIRWRDRKQGVDEALKAASQAWEAEGHDPAGATKAFRGWIRAHRKDLTDGVARYNSIDAKGRVYFAGDLSSPNPRANLQYDLPHPVTGLPVRMPTAGWRYGSEAMRELIAADRVIFGADHSTTAFYKRYLDEQVDETVGSVFERDRRGASGRLRGILTEDRFPNPKDHEVVARWIRITTPRDGIVLDFFGGSGSTLEAVLRLNAADGGTRQCILVTNNEVGSKAEKAMRKAGLRDGDPEWEAAGVCEYVTKPRIRTILTGIRPDGSGYADTVTGNVEFFDLTYEDPALVELDLAFERVAPLLWLAAGAHGDRIDAVTAQGWALTDRYGVLFTPDAQRQMLAAVTGQRMFFVVTDDEGQFQQIASQLPAGSRAVRLYESYLRTFQIGTAEVG